MDEFRAKSGQLAGELAGRSILILTTKGAKSGMSHETPLMYSTEGSRFIIAGGNGGSPKNPDWYHNLVQEPTASIELPTRTLLITAHEATGAERDRLHRQRLQAVPEYAENLKKTSRQIPLMILQPVS